MCGVKTVRNEHVYQRTQSKHGTSFNQYNKRSAHDKKNIENALEATVYMIISLYAMKTNTKRAVSVYIFHAGSFYACQTLA